MDTVEEVDNATRTLASVTPVERVLNGVRYLNENFPGWQTRIDHDTLNLGSAHDCICGQVFRQEYDEPNSFVKPGITVRTGYSYATSHLFPEANSWIAAMIPTNPKPDRTDFRNNEYGSASANFENAWETWKYENSDRAEKVAQFLGFQHSGTTDGNVSYNKLQRLWKVYLNDGEVALLKTLL